MWTRLSRSADGYRYVREKTSIFAFSSSLASKCSVYTDMMSVDVMQMSVLVSHYCVEVEMIYVSNVVEDVDFRVFIVSRVELFGLYRYDEC
jgi:hypothetical protein